MHVLSGEQVSEQRRLQREAKPMQMVLGDDPKKLTLRVKRTVNEVKPLEVEISTDQVNVAIISALSHECNTQESNDGQQKLSYAGKG